MTADQADTEPQATWYVLAAGLPLIQAPIQLAPGVVLRPLPHRLTELDLVSAAASGFQGAWAVAQVASMATCEIESHPSSEPGFDSINRAWLASTLLVLAGFHNVICPAAATHSWGELRETCKGIGWIAPDPKLLRLRTGIPGYRGTLLDLHLKPLSLPCEGEARPIDLRAEVTARFAACQHLYASSPSFALALGASVDWRYSGDFRAALSRLWAGIESLLGINSELVYRVSISAAALLEERGTARQERAKAIRKLYGLRSKAVHGEPITTKDMQAAARSSFQLLRGLLLHAVALNRVPTPDDIDIALHH